MQKNSIATRKHTYNNSLLTPESKDKDSQMNKQESMSIFKTLIDQSEVSSTSSMITNNQQYSNQFYICGRHLNEQDLNESSESSKEISETPPIMNSKLIKAYFDFHTQDRKEKAGDEIEIQHNSQRTSFLIRCFPNNVKTSHEMRKQSLNSPRDSED